jgi:hypothetical protein
MVVEFTTTYMQLMPITTNIVSAVIKQLSRITINDSFVAKRIAGPGLASNYFYQVF